MEIPGVFLNGRQLVAVHSTLGVLYRIDPSTDTATEIHLGGRRCSQRRWHRASRPHGLRRTELLNQVAVVSLDPQLSAGQVTELITSDVFRVPSTAARFGSSLYLVNARFDVAFPPFLGGEPMAFDYDVVRVPR